MAYQPDADPETPAEFERELEALLRTADGNGVDVRGAWECVAGSSGPVWDVHITAVRRD